MRIAGALNRSEEGRNSADVVGVQVKTDAARIEESPPVLGRRLISAQPEAH
jgi:hypothetical protein